VEDGSELRDRPGLGVRQCSELGDSPGEQVRLGHPPVEQVPFGLAQEHWPAEQFGQLGQRSVVRQCSELGHSSGEQVRFGLAHEYWPVEHFGQLGQSSVLQPLQYSTV